MTKKADAKKTAVLRPDPSVPALPGSDRPTEVEALINFRAYQYYSARGFENGHDLEDWLRAEQEVMRKRIHTLEM